MNRWTLSDASFEALLRMADNYGAEVPDNVTRDELEEIVEEAAEDWYLEHRRANSHSVRIEETKYDNQAARELEPWAEEDVELPESYNETRVVLMLRDPSWAFAYWDLSDAERHEFQRSETFEGLILRVFSMDEPETRLEAARQQFDIPVTLLDSRWYINLPDQETLYRLGLYASVDGAERRLAVSNLIVVPRGMIAEEPQNGEDVGDAIIAQTGIQDLDVSATGKRIPQRILDLIDEELLFN
ncbi:MAG: DUF4912 domain-containing protein [Spirochaetota bacterium]